MDVELFTSFLQGRYSESTLLFTLFARATIQVRQLIINVGFFYSANAFNPHYMLEIVSE